MLKAKLPISTESRRVCTVPENRCDDSGHLILNTQREARDLSLLYGEKFSRPAPSAGDLFAAAHIVAAWEYLLEYFARESESFEKMLLHDWPQPRQLLDDSLAEIAEDFPGTEVWKHRQTARNSVKNDPEKILRHWTLIHLAQNNPAFHSFEALFTHPKSRGVETQNKVWSVIENLNGTLKHTIPESDTTLATLRKPIEASPNSIKDQLIYILINWGSLLGESRAGLLSALDMIAEENRPTFSGPARAQGPGFDDLEGAAQFSSDKEWMPQVVLLAKNVLVWFDQLSRSYEQEIRRLDAIPDRELETIASGGFNALWLIGLWERSPASREIKQRMGNPEAAASAYSLFSYDIAGELGGWEALEDLKIRALGFGIRLSSDMVPNHVGIDSDWVRQHPERLLRVSSPPFPTYSYFSSNLSGDQSIDIRLEDHYWEKSDAAVVFQRRDKHSGETHYIYHGNDGTSMPWNDTAQIDFLNPEAREAVIQDILHVARNFPIIRFDAAMVLARKQIRRLWFPPPGEGGGIPSRSEFALDNRAFNEAIPEEFWREVVDRIAEEVPGTLLLAEAFWMMESYFVRTLGMHRVYNSAFMNMLRDQNNEEYRGIIKKTLEFDPGILQRFVNFMNNPDEDTAVEQFGKDDRYFAACTLLATLPGLPMFGHGQIEGFSEKYGMEYVKPYRDEHPDTVLLTRHEREIFPLLARRYLFAGAGSFRFYDFMKENGVVESVYVFSNEARGELVFVAVNNAFERAAGYIKFSSTANGNIASSLLPSNAADGDWFLRKDLMSSLWFICSAADLREYGLELSLDGFGRHVCLEFRVVSETDDALWGKLAAELDGNGVPDPDLALRELRLRPLKHSLDTLLPPRTVQKLAESIQSGKQPLWPENLQSAREALDVLCQFHPSHNIDCGEMIRQINRKLNNGSKLWRRFRRGLRYRLARGVGKADYDEAVFLASYAILSVVAKGLWDSWGLDCWIKQQSGAMAGTQIQRALECALAVPDWSSLKAAPRQVLRKLFSVAEVRRFCGVNSWDGQLWYKLEDWNAFVRGTALSAAAESIPHRYIRRLIRRWISSHRKADYRVEALLGNVVDGPWWAK